MYIVENSHLRELCERATIDGRVGLDLEFIRERSFYPQLALIQIAVGESYHLIDPLGSLDLTPLEDLVINPDVEKVLHAATQDLEIFFNRVQQPPVNIFDTQIAAAMIGLGNQVAYGGLVDRLLGVNLKKGESYTDWLKRPLSSKQESYAIDDVRYLFGLREAMGLRLEKLNRSAWVEEECRRYESREYYVPDPQSLYQKVKRFGTLDVRGQLILRELAIWRDDEAKQRDKPRRSIVSDEVLIEVSRSRPTKASSLANLRGLHPREFKRSAEAMVDCVSSGMKKPESEMPREEKRRRLTLAAEQMVDFLQAFLKAECHAAEISSTMVANASQVQALVREFLEGRHESSSLPIVNGWRGDLIGNKLLAFLRGEVSVHLDPDHHCPVFEQRIT